MKVKLVLTVILAVCTLASVMGGYWLFESSKVLDDVGVSRSPASGEEGEAGADGAKQAKAGGDAKAEGKKAEGGEAKAEGSEGVKISFGTAGGSSISMGEIFVNVNHNDNVHYLKLDAKLELFSREDRSFVAKHKPALKSLIIEISRAQPYSELSSMMGKLYFKERLVSSLNSYLNMPAIREIHFQDFFLQ